ncbi:HPr serine kinase domain-containing protein [Candidatus Nitrosoglobus terrae]|uniref:HPr serine kinase domain-containing protein n=1 Tax=Candidatus Nitrosoglobus terrae TaxID=1630141 RepID=A0A1Q2SPA6_9GAMM|nr:HPr kinase/phosphorylase-related protein [Candidatus Nitrosoglobus terrae]BAW80995.1 HPr serine kinase domain-containing protein [Candidatus Nitrosoglobus terrae]
MDSPSQSSAIGHGVLLVIFNLGVLLTGESGIGKSSLALELIRRGHHLIADDTPIFHREGSTKLIGSCPYILQDFLAVPGLGVINIRAIYGDQAIIDHHPLDFVIRLIPNKYIEPLTRSLGQWEQLGIKMTELTLPLAGNIPQATMIETAVQDYQLRLKNYDALLELQKRQNKSI